MHGDFDQAFCIVLDINLSDGSGIELRHQLAEAGIDLPVIYITGNDSDATRMAAMASGCLAYLTKPFTAQSLIEPIERAAAALAVMPRTDPASLVDLLLEDLAPARPCERRRTGRAAATS